MKKFSFIASALVAAMMASCGPSTPTASLNNEADTLAYCAGMANSYGLKDYLAMSMDVDTTDMSEFLRGFNEGVASVQGSKDKAYYVGLQIGRQVAEQMVGGLNRELYGADSSLYQNGNNLVAGFVAAVTGKNAIMTVEQATEYLQTNLEAIKARISEQAYADNKKAGEDFMAEVASREGIKQIDSTGVFYEVLTEGTGAIPADTSVVKVKYEGTLIDGTVFDGNMADAEPMAIACNRVIAGWTAALTHMPAGSKWKVYIPQEMAYGSRAAGATIKPYSALVFVIDLVSVD